MEPKTAQKAINTGIEAGPAYPLTSEERVAESMSHYDDPPIVTPIGEIDQQIRNLRSSRESLEKMMADTDTAIKGLLEAKREGIVGQVASLEQELADIDDQIGAGYVVRRAARTGPGSGICQKAADWLKAHTDREWRGGDISDGIGIARRNNVGALLKGYVARGQVRKRGNRLGGVYFTWVGDKSAFNTENQSYEKANG